MIIRFLIIVFALFVFSCTNCSSINGNDNKASSQDAVFKDAYHEIDSEILFDAHKEAMRKEKIQIDDFLERYKWKMETSPTGLRYMIYEKGNGKKAQQGDIVELEYTVKFLNGEVVYSSDNDGVKIFQLSRSQEVSGLEEGILMMSCGDKARLIVPSFLAYGVTGDLKKISVKNTLVYDIHLVGVR